MVQVVSCQGGPPHKRRDSSAECLLYMIHNNIHFSLITNMFPSSSSHSQRRDAPAGGGYCRQGSQEQWRGQDKAQVREVEEDERCQQQGKETVPRGACQTMCPARELRDREAQNRLHRFEIVAGMEKVRRPRGDPLRAVKEYCRPAAGKDSTNPNDLRPPAVLLKTVCYLIDDIAASPHLHPWTEASSIYISFSQSPSFHNSYIMEVVCLK